MKESLAKASAKKLENDDRVEWAEVDRNEKGIYIEARAIDRMAARDLKGDLDEYPVYVEVIS